MSHVTFSRPLEDGDIVNITVYVDGHHGDTLRTFLVGDMVSDGVGTAAEPALIISRMRQDTRPSTMSQTGEDTRFWPRGRRVAVGNELLLIVE